MLTIIKFETPLGIVQATADNAALHSLEFTDDSHIPNAYSQNYTAPLHSIEKELAQYFKGQLTEFKTPLYFNGTSFQKQVWEALQKIPFGATWSYSELAKVIGKPAACRAAAQANGANKHIIIVPCHRVINANGNIGGYSSGVSRKKWLLDHELG